MKAILQFLPGTALVGLLLASTLYSTSAVERPRAAVRREGCEISGAPQTLEIDGGVEQVATWARTGTHDRARIVERWKETPAGHRWEIEIAGEGAPWSAPIEASFPPVPEDAGLDETTCHGSRLHPRSDLAAKVGPGPHYLEYATVILRTLSAGRPPGVIVLNSLQSLALFERRKGLPLLAFSFLANLSTQPEVHIITTWGWKHAGNEAFSSWAQKPHSDIRLDDFHKTPFIVAGDGSRGAFASGKTEGHSLDGFKQE